MIIAREEWSSAWAASGSSAQNEFGRGDGGDRRSRGDDDNDDDGEEGSEDFRGRT